MDMARTCKQPPSNANLNMCSSIYKKKFRKVIWAYYKIRMNNKNFGKKLIKSFKNPCIFSKIIANFIAVLGSLLGH